MSSLPTTSALDNAYNDALGNAISSATGSSEMDKQAFLMLLVTQFQYQDPLNPMEDKEFVAQLAQFSALEQSMTTNENLSSLIGIQQQQSVISASNYIGKEVSARGYGISLKEGAASTVQYAAAEEMSSCVVNILDTTTNTIVNSYELGKKAASIHEFVWDGKRADGATAADGVYTVSFVGYNTEGERIMVDTSVTGKVNGVSNYNGELYLRMDDGRSVTMENVREVLLSNEVPAANPTDPADPADPTDPADGDDDGDGTDATDDTDDSTDPADSTDSTDPADTTPTPAATPLGAEIDAIAQNAKDAVAAWMNARDEIAALLAGNAA